MFIFIFRVLLIYWIISAIIKWFSRLSSSGKSSGPVGSKGHDTNTPVDMNLHGKIDDAEFEEIDSE